MDGWNSTSGGDGSTVYTPQIEAPRHECSVACGGGRHAVVIYADARKTRQSVLAVLAACSFIMPLAHAAPSVRVVGLEQATEALPFHLFMQQQQLSTRGLPDQAVRAWLLICQEEEDDHAR